MSILKSSFCYKDSAEWSNQINGTKFMVKMKYFEFSTRWNLAEFMIPVHLEATLIQSWFVQNNGNQIWNFCCCYLWIIITSKLLKLESFKTTQIKEFSKLFKTNMDFNHLSVLVIEQSLIKGLRPLFFCHCHTLKPLIDCISRSF